MKPIRQYTKASMWFRDDAALTDNEYYDICLYSNMVIFLDSKGKEITLPMLFVKKIIEYKEDRQPQMPDPRSAGAAPTTDLSNEIRKGGPIKSPTKGGAVHV